VVFLDEAEAKLYIAARDAASSCYGNPKSAKSTFLFCAVKTGQKDNLACYPIAASLTLRVAIQ
jgi:hypothetical protein